jgi:hypothetical protein
MGDRGGRARPRALVQQESLLAAALFALFVLAYLWPALLGGKMLSPLASLYGSVPWQGVQPPDLHDYLNPLLADVPTADYPWRLLARDLIREGTFPAWNPHVFAGIPFFANPQTMVLSPFSLPLWLLPLHYAVGLAAALMLWTAAFGTYLLVRELGLRFLPGLLAGAAYALCSFHVVWLTHGSLPAVSALLPWMLWLIERVVRRGTLAPALWLALATAVALTGGHPGTQVHVLGAAGVYAVLRAALGSELPAPARWRRLALAGGGLVAGVALVGVMFVPELLASRGTLGTQARAGGGELPGTHMPFGAVLSALFPDWWGRPSAMSIQGPEFHAQPGLGVEVTFNERTFFAGVVTLALAGVALLAGARRRAQVPFLVLAALALAIPLHAPGLYQLVEHLPGFSLVQNQRMHFVFELAAAVLAAFGLDALLSGRVGRRALLAPLALLAGVVLAVVALGARAEDARQVAEHFLTGADVATETALSLTSVAWTALFAAAAGVALLAMRRWPRRLGLIAALLVLLVAFDMLRFAHGYQPMGDPGKVIPPKTPAIRYLERHRDEGRVVGLGFAFPNDWTLVYGLRDVRGYDPPYPSLRLYRLWLLANPGQEDWAGFRVAAMQRQTRQVMNVLGARWVVADPGTRIDPLVSPGVRLVYRGPDATVFENAGAAPRAFVPQTVELAEGEQAANATLVADDFDVRRMAVVEQGAAGMTALVGAPPVHGRVAVAHEHNARVELRATLDRRGLVVLDDALFDGWRVEVDGRSAPVVRVDSVLRGVVVPAGTHRIVWSYTVPGIRLGAALSLFAALALLAAALLSRRRAGAPARGSSGAGEARRAAHAAPRSHA